MRGDELTGSWTVAVLSGRTACIIPDPQKQWLWAIAVILRKAPPRACGNARQPALLLHRGVFLDDAMRGERVSEAEVLAAIRAGGIAAVEDVRAVVLETDGTISVIRTTDTASVTSLRDVAHVGHGRAGTRP